MKQRSTAFRDDRRPILGGTGARFALVLAAVALTAFIVVPGPTLAGASATIDPATQAASKSLEKKLQILDSQDLRPSASYPAVIITENEVNSYMKVHSSEFLPAGVGTPTLRIQPEHATASGDVDFPALSRSYPDPNDIGLKVLAAMFPGPQHVTVTAKVQSEDAGVRVQIESVVVGSMTVPKWLVDYLILNVLQPRYKFDLSKPLAYPNHVSRIVLGSGQTTFLRGAKTGK